MTGLFHQLKTKGVLVLLSIVLVGCYVPPNPDKVTTTEKIIFRTINKESNCTSLGFYNAVTNAISARSSKPENTKESLCDVLPEIRLSILAGKDHLDEGHALNILDVYKTMYGEDLETVCDREKKPLLQYSPVEEVITENVPEPERQNVVTIEGDLAVLSPKMMDSLKEAVNSCPRAKDKYMSLTEQGEVLNVGFYKQMAAIIHKCQVMEIEKAL